VAVPRLSSLLPLGLAIAAPAADAQRVGVQDMDRAQVTIRERVIIRVPRMGPLPRAAGRTAIRPLPPPVVWQESKGPKCIATGGLAGAAIGPEGEAVDLVLTGGKRVRAELDGDCEPLDFYSGFYLRQAADGMVCAKRDPIRVRSGASCTIKRFRTLTPKR
jgi:hypothetical protein